MHEHSVVRVCVQLHRRVYAGMRMRACRHVRASTRPPLCCNRLLPLAFDATTGFIWAMQMRRVDVGSVPGPIACRGDAIAHVRAH
eukprot:1242952-Pleurochrysis_carterae.AAC.1